MQDTSNSNTRASPDPGFAQQSVPFLRAIVSEGFVGGHDVPLSRLSKIVGRERQKGTATKRVGSKT